MGPRALIFKPLQGEEHMENGLGRKPPKFFVQETGGGGGGLSLGEGVYHTR